MKDVLVENADAFDRLEELPENIGHAAVVDYPWKFNGENGTGRFQGDKDSREFDVYPTEDSERLSDIFESLSRGLRDGSWLFVFADDDTYPTFRRILERSPLTYRRTCVWDRVKFGMGYYHRVQHYPILTATVGDTDRRVMGRGTVFRAQRNDFTAVYNDDAYPTSKPVGLYRQLLDSPVLESGERLLEPFCGTAPGAQVAAERGLQYWGCDVNDSVIETARDAFRQQRFSTDGGDRP